MADTPGLLAHSGVSAGDILGHIFGRGMPGSASEALDPGQKFPPPASQPPPLPTDAGGQPNPEGDILGSILRELEKGIREGRIKPVIIGGGAVPQTQPGGQKNTPPPPPHAPPAPARRDPRP